MAANVRQRERLNYRELADVKLPRARKKSKTESDELYPVEVVHSDSEGRVKVHYLGYSSCHDEWRDGSELVPLEPNSARETASDSNLYSPFSLYYELGTRIKAALMSRRKESPTVKIELPFDKVLFEGGIKACGTVSKHYRGVQRYKITNYTDLDPMLGNNWHFRGINSTGDFCFVILDTVEYYLHRRASLVEYYPRSSNSALDGIDVTSRPRELGHMLVFTFIRGDGTKQDFGKDITIFSNCT